MGTIAALVRIIITLDVAATGNTVAGGMLISEDGCIAVGLLAKCVARMRAVAPARPRARGRQVLLSVAFQRRLIAMSVLLK